MVRGKESKEMVVCGKRCTSRGVREKRKVEGGMARYMACGEVVLRKGTCEKKKGQFRNCGGAFSFFFFFCV